MYCLIFLLSTLRCTVLYCITVSVYCYKLTSCDFCRIVSLQNWQISSFARKPAEKLLSHGLKVELWTNYWTTLQVFLDTAWCRTSSFMFATSKWGFWSTWRTQMACIHILIAVLGTCATAPQWRYGGTCRGGANVQNWRSGIGAK